MPNKLIHLRNQDKIKAVLGDENLIRIKSSIQSFIDSGKDINPEIIEGSKYKIMIIDDITKENGMIAFYIIETLSVYYKIAFKEFIE